MKKMFLFYGLLTLLGCSLVVAGDKVERKVAVTIDDVPFVLAGYPSGDYKSLKKEKTQLLLKKIREFNVPAVGFAISNRLHDGDNGNPHTANLELIDMWADAGLEVGAHSYAHPSAHWVPVDKYIADIQKGHVLLKPVLEKKGKTLRYFRHPLLHTGRTPEIKKQIKTALDQMDLTIAPVTVDNSEFLFAQAYNKAGVKGDKALQKRIADAYITYMEKMVVYYENLSINVLGYRVKHVLLLHANVLNADHIDRLFIMLRKRGYNFITLEEALKDKAYRIEDKYTGKMGISWLHRWAVAEGKPSDLENEPQPPLFVKEAADM